MNLTAGKKPRTRTNINKKKVNLTIKKHFSLMFRLIAFTRRHHYYLQPMQARAGMAVGITWD
jgi:hypothetical protein